MELFRERGYEQTTVAEIAAARRPDRAHVLQALRGQARGAVRGHDAHFRENFVGSAGRRAGLGDPAAGGGRCDPRLRAQRLRSFAAASSLAPASAIIAANPELRERELIKLADVASAMAEALRRRGVPEPSASMTAELGMAAFRVAFERWVADGEQRSFLTLVDEALTNVAAAVVA